MFIRRLELSNYRNYKSLDISFSEKVNLVLGDNAQGKTNLIEAIYLAAMGRSFRTNHDNELIRFGEDLAVVRIEAEKSIGTTEVEIMIKSRGVKSSDKYIRKDKKNLTKTSQLLRNIVIVIFSPEDLKLVKEEPEKRRRFIDRELCQISPAYYDSFASYRQTLLQRNTYLKEERPDPEILDIWDMQLAKHGSRIIKGRSAFVKKIGRFSKEIHYGITGGDEGLEIIYEPNIKEASDLETQEQEFYAAIKRSFESDIKNRNTQVGPHRDDIAFFVNGVDMRNFGSQGQQRTCALSLKLAELELIKDDTGEDAILLLDDVMSELDGRRQEYLIKTLKNNQLFITTTDVDQNIRSKFSSSALYKVADGEIVRER